VIQLRTETDPLMLTTMARFWWSTATNPLMSDKEPLNAATVVALLVITRGQKVPGQLMATPGTSLQKGDAAYWAYRRKSLRRAVVTGAVGVSESDYSGQRCGLPRLSANGDAREVPAKAVRQVSKWPFILSDWCVPWEDLVIQMNVGGVQSNNEKLRSILSRLSYISIRQAPGWVSSWLFWEGCANNTE